MKNKYTHLSVYILVALILVIAGFNMKPETAGTNKTSATDPAHLKNNVKKISEVISEKKSSYAFAPVDMFAIDNSSAARNGLSSFVSEASTLKLDSRALSSALNASSENVEFRIPVDAQNSMTLELTKANVYAEGFKVTDERGNEVNYEKGLHYRGIIKGDENSIASISIFKDNVMGVISNASGNYVLGTVKADNKPTANYVFYNDNNMLIADNFKCGVEDMDPKFILNKGQHQPTELSIADDAQRNPVRVHFVADYNMYQRLGSQSAVANFVSGFFNSVATIYQNEYLVVQVMDVQVYTSTDPYASMNNSETVLTTFGQNTQDGFSGELAHLLSTRTANLGGIAWINVLCASYNPQYMAGRYAFSNIDPDYQNYPTYSWTVNVVTHEMGHNFGSQHTHACVWPVRSNGGIGAIDSCYNAEGNCFQTPRARVGTIMSYCHLWTAGQGGGVNLSLGFGPLPGDTIRYGYNTASCLGPVVNSSEIPIAFKLLQNYPNPFNPATNIKFALPVDAIVTLKVYDMSGKEIANLIDSKFYNAGIFTQGFNTLQYNLASGVYFYRIDAVNPAQGNAKVFTEVRKMILVK